MSGSLLAILTAAAVLLPGGEPETLGLEGVFVEREPVVINYRPEVATGEVEILEIAAEGAIDRGDVLVRFRATELDEKIAEAELDLVTARAGLALLREETGRAEEARQLELLGANLRVVDAERALTEEVTINAPRRLLQSEDRVRNQDAIHEEREEQFRVLVRMYEADSVIEVTERMDMESQRRRLDRANRLRPNVVTRHEILAEITIPRAIAELEHAVRKARHASDLLRATSAARLAQKRNELSKSELSFRRQEQRLEELRRDRDALTVRAPVDGLAIAGHYRGKWASLGKGGRRLRAGARISPGQVLFTIVQPAPRAVRTSVPEGRRFAVREGQGAVLIPTAVPELTLPARVTRIAPYARDGRHEVWLEARIRHERLLPGSTCRVEIALPSPPVGEDQ